MKKYEIEKSVVERKVRENTLCDKCNKEIKTESQFDVFEFELKCKKGSNIYGDVWGNKSEVHLCEFCAKRLIDDLIDMGYRVNSSEY